MGHITAIELKRINVPCNSTSSLLCSEPLSHASGNLVLELLRNKYAANDVIFINVKV